MEGGVDAPPIEGKDVPGNEGHGAQHDAQIEPQLFPQKGLLDLPQQKQEIDREVHPEEGHKHGADRLKIGGVCRHGAVFDAEAAGARRTEGGTQAVKERHAPRQEEEDAQYREGDIDGVQNGGALPGLGHQLIHTGSGAFGPEQVDAVAPLAHGHHRQQEHQNTHAAQPVGEGTPEEKGPGHILHTGEDGGSRGGKA